MIEKKYSARVRLLHKVAAGLVLFIAVQMTCLFSICLRAEAAHQLQAQVRTVKLKVASVKRHGKKINWHRFLPRKYRTTYHVLQGVETDGKYIYLNFWDQKRDKCIMVKVNAKTRKRVRASAPLRLYHGNDIAYDPSSKLLYVVYSDLKPFQVTIVDSKTLTIRGYRTVRIPPGLEGMQDTGTTPDSGGTAASAADPNAAGVTVSAGSVNIAELTGNISQSVTGLVGITYNAKKHQFAMRVAGKNDFIILNEALNPVRYVTVTKTPSLRKQSMDSDNKYVYICMDKAGSYNLIMVYDWEGTFIKKFRVPLAYEIEGVFHIGKNFYAAFYDTHGPFSFVYKMKDVRKHLSKE